jgi:hypothetical protein
MRVTEPRVGPSPLREGRQRITVSVAYERGSHPPEEYWIDAPVSAGALTTSGNPWMVALLPLAATLDEPLTVAAPVDETLLDNLREILRIWRTWYPYVGHVALEAPRADAGRHAGGGRVGALFSGGVDSFYTLLRDRAHLHPSQRVRIEDLITIWGFDIPLSDFQAFERLRARFRRFADSAGCELVDVATNLRDTRWRESSWGEIAHGCVLASVCHALESRLARVLIPATGGYRDLHPWASHALTDPLFSSATLQFVHDGAAAKRIEKLEAIAASPGALGELRVCWRARSDVNCGQCTKCLRTMLALQLHGAPNGSSTFPRPPVEAREARRMHCTWPWDYRELRDLAALASERGRSDLAEALKSAMRQSRIRGRLLEAVGSGRRVFGRRIAGALERLLMRGRIR